MLDPVVARIRLATQPHPPEARPPSWRLLVGEALFRLRKGNTPDIPPAIQPRAVMLVPGFGAHVVSMWRMELALRRAGHRVSDWGQGFNLGPSETVLDALTLRTVRKAERAGQPLVLVGWSLGGIFAREIARRVPHAVAGVITMGTPFSGNRRANNAWRAYHLITGHDVDSPPVDGNTALKPPVPTVALWSARDGIIAPRCAKGAPDERDRAIALRCTHLGFVSDPEAITVVARLLDSPQEWQCDRGLLQAA